MSDTNGSSDTRRQGERRPHPKTSTTSRITFASELAPREGEEVLSEEDAVTLLGRRFGLTVNPVPPVRKVWDVVNPLPFGGHGRAEQDVVAHRLMTHIVRALPPESRTQSVLSHVDIRAILDELVVTEEQAQRRRGVHYINDVPFSPEERVKAGELLAEQNSLIEEQALVAAAAMEGAGAFSDAANPALARQQWIETATNGWRRAGGELGPTPALVTETQTAENAADREAATEQLAETSLSLRDQLLAEAGLISGQGTAFQYLQEADLDFMYGTDMVAWNQILDALRADAANKSSARAAGAANVPDDIRIDTGGLLGDEAVRRSDIRFGGDVGSAVTDGRRIRLLDAYNSLNSSKRTPAELRNLQDKLIAGGYLDEDDVRYWGTATDAATREAWRTLIRDTRSVGKDMNTVLRDATLAKREEDEIADKAAQRDLVLTSSVGIQSTSDALGQQVIGRKLSGNDHAKLIEFIHALERDQHSTLAPEGGQEAEAIDVESEVNAWIEREHGVESGAYDLLEQFNAFQQIARRPG